MIIIEFCGSPGCGKSTTCDLLEKRLSELGYKVVNLQKREKCDSFMKKCRKLWRMISYHVYRRNIKLRHSLYSFTYFRKRKWADRILECKWLIDKHDNYDFVLFDEGCIQFLSSLLEEKLPKKTSMFKVINSEFYIIPTILFNCNLDPGENIKRLKDRNRPGDRFISGSIEEIEQRLFIKRELLNYILSFDWERIEKHEINTMDTDKALENCLEFCLCRLQTTNYIKES